MYTDEWLEGERYISEKGATGGGYTADYLEQNFHYTLMKDRDTGEEVKMYLCEDLHYGPTKNLNKDPLRKTIGNSKVQKQGKKRQTNAGNSLKCVCQNVAAKDCAHKRCKSCCPGSCERHG
jgi:hypothetical protein